MVVIRLARGGSKKNPFYHVVVTDRRNARDGRFIERVGYFDPMARGKATRLTLEKDRIQHWVSQGALPSQRVQTLLKEVATSADAEQQAPTKAQQRIAQSQHAIQANASAKKESKESNETEASE